MLTWAGHEGEPEPIDPAHLPDVLESLAQAKRPRVPPLRSMELRFTKGGRDVIAIADYIRERNPAAAERVRAAIY